MPGAASSTFAASSGHGVPRAIGLIGDRLAAWSARAAAGADAPALAELNGFAQQLQQVARLAGHPSAAPWAAVDMAAAVRAVVEASRAEAEQARLALQVDGPPILATMPAAAFTLLVELLVAQALACGERLHLSTAWHGAPARPALRAQLARRVSGPGPDADAGELPLLLAALLARSLGFAWLSSEPGRPEILVLCPPLAAEPASAGPAGPDPDEGLPRTPAAAGGRVLLLDPVPSARELACQLLDGAGLSVTPAADLDQARDALRAGDPDVLLTGLPIATTPGLAALIDDMRLRSPWLRVIELVDEPNAYAFSLPGEDAPGRLSRSELREHLLTAVAQEIDGTRGI